MTPPKDNRVGIGVVSRLQRQIELRPRVRLPDFDKQAEALKLVAEYTPETIAAMKPPLPSWVRCEFQRFFEGVEWAQLHDRWDIDGQTPRVLNRFAYMLKLVVAWWEDNRNIPSHVLRECPDDTGWADFDWDTGDESPLWHFRFPHNTRDEENFIHWRKHHFRLKRWIL